MWQHLCLSSSTCKSLFDQLSSFDFFNRLLAVIPPVLYYSYLLSLYCSWLLLLGFCCLYPLCGCCLWVYPHFLICAPYCFLCLVLCFGVYYNGGHFCCIASIPMASLCFPLFVGSFSDPCLYSSSMYFAFLWIFTLSDLPHLEFCFFLSFFI